MSRLSKFLLQYKDLVQLYAHGGIGACLLILGGTFQIDHPSANVAFKSAAIALVGWFGLLGFVKCLVTFDQEQKKVSIRDASPDIFGLIMDLFMLLAFAFFASCTYVAVASVLLCQMSQSEVFWVFIWIAVLHVWLIAKFIHLYRKHGAI